MTYLLVYVLVILIVAVLCIYLVNQVEVDPPLNKLLKIVIVVVALVAIFVKSGFLR